jgi:hypothetical protein
MAVETAGSFHEAIVTDGGATCVLIEAFTWVNTMIGNVKMQCMAHTIQLALIICPVTWQSFAIALTNVTIYTK